MIPYLCQTEQGYKLFLTQKAIQKDELPIEFLKRMYAYDQFPWPEGMTKLSQKKCRKMAGKEGNYFSLEKPKVFEEFKKRVLEEPAISEKKLSTPKSAINKSLDPVINEKLFLDKADQQSVSKKTDTSKVTYLGCDFLLTDSELGYVVSHFPNLKKLSLVLCKKITDKGLSHLKKLPFLESLTLNASYDEETRNITNEGLSCLKSLPLRFLDLSYFWDITDETIALFKKCPLECLYLVNSNITDKGLSYLVNFPGLKNLSLHDCEDITKDGLNVFKTLPLLEKLDLLGCEGLPTEFRENCKTKTEVEKFLAKIASPTP